MICSTNPLGKEKSLQISGSLLTVFSPLSGRHEQSRRQHPSLRRLRVLATSFPGDLANTMSTSSTSSSTGPRWSRGRDPPTHNDGAIFLISCVGG